MTRAQENGALICHIQIAKAATNSMRRILANNVPEAALKISTLKLRSQDGLGVTTRSGVPEIEALIDDIRQKEHQLAAVSMMVPVGLHEHVERPVTYVSIMRDPMKRCLSAINFVYARRDKHPAAEHFASLNYSPAQLIEAQELLFINDQVRMLSATEQKQITRTHLEEAKLNIDKHFKFIGVSEAPEQCWRRLETLFGWKTDPTLVLNKGTYDPSLSFTAQDLEALRSANSFDQQLYDWVISDYLPRRHDITLSRQTC